MGAAAARCGALAGGLSLEHAARQQRQPEEGLQTEASGDGAAFHSDGVLPLLALLTPFPAAALQAQQHQL